MATNSASSSGKAGGSKAQDGSQGGVKQDAFAAADAKQLQLGWAVGGGCSIGAWTSDPTSGSSSDARVPPQSNQWVGLSTSGPSNTDAPPLFENARSDSWCGRAPAAQVDLVGFNGSSWGNASQNAGGQSHAQRAIFIWRDVCTAEARSASKDFYHLRAVECDPVVQHTRRQVGRQNVEPHQQAPVGHRRRPPEHHRETEAQLAWLYGMLDIAGRGRIMFDEVQPMYLCASVEDYPPLHVFMHFVESDSLSVDYHGFARLVRFSTEEVGVTIGELYEACGGPVPE